MKKHYLFLLLSIGFFSSVMAQTTLKGKVVAKDDGMPIPGAAIVPNNETQNGVATDFDGNFTLVVNQSKGVIRISSLGFDTIELSYSGNETFTIALENQTTGLDEVVLIGYGSAKKGDITSAIATVENIETIGSRPVSSLAAFLQGNVPGVTVLNQGGDPSGNPSIVVRGIGSLNGDGILTVVDGVPYFGPQLNPNDIASVNILKDAAAAAVYGATAGTAVIVIQTKKGELGKPRVSIDLYTGFQNAMNLPTALTARQQADTYNLAAFNGGSPRQSAHDGTTNPWGQVTRTNWMEEIFRSATIQNVNARISGASENINYMASYGYHKKEGVLLGTNREDYSFRLKTDYKITDKLTIGENVSFFRKEAFGTNTRSGYSGVILSALYMPSAAPVYDEFGEFHGVSPYDLAQFAGAYGDVYNPVALLLRPTRSNPTNTLITNVYGEYKIIDGLKFKSTYSYTYDTNTYKSFSPRRPELGRTNLSNELEMSSGTTNRWLWDNQLTYLKSFGDHNLNLTAVYSSQFRRTESFGVSVDGFASEAVYNQFLNNGANYDHPWSGVSEEALTSAIGRAMYNYKNKYYITGSIRRDESSKLAVDNQVDFFPAASVGWTLSKEDFFTIDAINSLKFRASWGQIGNIGSVGVYSFNVPLSTQTVLLGEDGSQDEKGVYAGSASNPNLKWETSESINFGVDAFLFNNSLSITADYFERTTINMLLRGEEDKHHGTSAPIVNGGEVKNSGFELSVSYNKSIGDLNYTIRGNVSKIKNELVNLDGFNKAGLEFIRESTNVRDVLFPFRSQVGRALFTNHLIPYVGIFQTQAEIDAHAVGGVLIQPNAVPGDMKFEDTNKDGSIDDEDRVFMGSYFPDVTYNMGINLEYKGFDLNLNIQGVSGSKIFNGYKFLAYNAGLQGYNLDNRILNAWTPTHTNTDIPRISTKDNNNNFGRTSSWFLEDGSYVRLKNVTLGYTIPKDVLNGIDIRLFLSAENLFTITDYSGMDPEVGGRGLDLAKYPVSRTVTLGASIKL